MTNLIVILLSLLSFHSLHGCEWDHQPLTLKLVQVLHVHGACSFGPSVSSEDKLKSIETSQLTNAAKQEQYAFGTYLREKYNDLLGDVYNRSLTVARSSDYDKTLTSAYCVLAGLFPPKAKQIWNKAFKWQPIPVHTVPNHQDYEFTDYLKNIIERETIGLKEMGFIAEYLTYSKNFSSDILQWANENGHSVADLAKKAIRKLFETQKLQFLKSGMFLKEIIGNIQRKLNSSDPFDNDKRLFLYTSNDLLLYAFTSLLNLTNGAEIQINDKSALIIELLQASNETLFIKFLYRNDTTGITKVLQVLGCEAFCQWEKFLKLTKQFMSKDIANECKSNALTEFHGSDNTAKGSPLDFRLITFAGTAAVVTIGIMAAVYSVLRKRNRNILRIRSNYTEIK